MPQLAGIPLGGVIEIGRAGSNQTYGIDRATGAVLTDNAGNPQDADQRWREGGKLPVYDADTKIELNDKGVPPWEFFDTGIADYGEAEEAYERGLDQSDREKLAQARRDQAERLRKHGSEADPDSLEAKLRRLSDS